MLSLANNFDQSKSYHFMEQKRLYVTEMSHGGGYVNYSHRYLKLNYFQSHRLEDCMAYIYPNRYDVCIHT